MNAHILSKIMPWQTALAQAITSPRELIDILELNPNLLKAAESAAALFPLIVPRGFVGRMQKGNPKDPLLLQVLPLGVEREEVPGYVQDPLEESKANPTPGLLHKYQGRVLLTLVGKCAINCRFCFRRHFPYADNNPGSAGWEKAVEYIAQDASISEVILSGGDPLICSDKFLLRFSEKLNTIPHVKRLRIHTRLPIVLPERISTDFIHWVMQLKQKPIIVVHCNHPQEINQDVNTAMRALTEAGVVLLNQAVLLKGINDTVETLVALSEALFTAGVQPYYLHILDKVRGTAHFDLSKEKALSLHEQMGQKLSGYLVPRLVHEQAGAPAKINLVPGFG